MIVGNPETDPLPRSPGGNKKKLNGPRQSGSNLVPCLQMISNDVRWRPHRDSNPCWNRQILCIVRLLNIPFKEGGDRFQGHLSYCSNTRVLFGIGSLGNLTTARSLPTEKHQI